MNKKELKVTQVNIKIYESITSKKDLLDTHLKKANGIILSNKYSDKDKTDLLSSLLYFYINREEQKKRADGTW